MDADALRRTSRALVVTGSALSIAGCAFIFTSWALFRELRRSVSFRILVWLSVADFGASVAVLIDATRGDSDALCYAAAGMSQFFDVASFLWNSALAHVVYSTFVRERPLNSRTELWCHVSVWTTALVLLLPPLAARAFGQATIWCWIRGEPEFFPLRVLCYYLPLVAVCVHNTVAYTIVTRRVRTKLPTVDEPGTGRADQGIVRRLRLYMVVFLVVRLPSVLHRGLQLTLIGRSAYVPPSAAEVGLQLLHATFSPLQGLFNALVYGVNRNVLARFAQCAGMLGSADARHPRQERGMVRMGTDVSDHSSSVPTHPSDLATGPAHPASVQAT